MTQHFDELMTIRDGNPDDQAFIYATWLRGLYYGNPWYKQIHPEIYFKTYHRALEMVLSRPETTIKVACFKDDAGVLTGYCVYQGPTLHFVFVKKVWRRIGIAKRLIPEGIKQVTHFTTQGLNLKPKEWVFNPFAL